MSQINFRIDEFTNEYIEFKSKMDGKSKAAISKEIFQKGLKEEMFPFLANLYKEGKISVKKIAYITGIHPSEIYPMLPKYIDDIEMDDAVLRDFGKFHEKFVAYLKDLKKKGISFSDGIILD
jgi:hypothetical protein